MIYLIAASKWRGWIVVIVLIELWGVEDWSPLYWRHLALDVRSTLLWAYSWEPQFPSLSSPFGDTSSRLAQQSVPCPGWLYIRVQTRLISLLTEETRLLTSRSPYRNLVRVYASGQCPPKYTRVCLTWAYREYWRLHHVDPNQLEPQGY